LRSQRDKDALRAGVATGAITAISSDHQPHDADAKLAPFQATEPGISALETLLPLTLRLAQEGLLSLSEAIARITSGPSSVLGIPAGSLAVGATADICVVDPERHWNVVPATLRSRGKNSPFLEWELIGRVSHTLLEGEIVHSDEE
jgi:dihydroorotase